MNGVLTQFDSIDSDHIYCFVFVNTPYAPHFGTNIKMKLSPNLCSKQHVLPTQAIERAIKKRKLRCRQLTQTVFRWAQHFEDEV